ncbi:MAG: hypothetical protein JKY95_08535 [Planctomycetaceae bacterium]|nr:hypothetical protein [Planctomycetaceae bacterium]
MKTISITLFLLLAVAMLGCNSSTETPAASENASESDDAHADHDHGNHDGKSDMEMMKENLAKLSPEDAASAEKQHICPVTGEMLGTMGLPIKVTVKDQDVWVCCDHCVDKLKTDPEKYIAKLKK